jgi:hypothetical protein
MPLRFAIYSLKITYGLWGNSEEPTSHIAVYTHKDDIGSRTALWNFIHGNQSHEDHRYQAQTNGRLHITADEYHIRSREDEDQVHCLVLPLSYYDVLLTHLRSLRIEKVIRDHVHSDQIVVDCTANIPVREV